MNLPKNIKIEWFDELDSTSNYAKAQRDKKENLVIIAKRQTGGRGTKGRSFSSEEGGIYMSILTFYPALPADKTFKIMQHTTAAVCKALYAYGLNTRIKWPNDIYVADKKICGILIENTLQGKFVQNSVVGIGINVHNQLPDELKEIATTMEEQTGKRFPVEHVVETLLKELSIDCVGEYLSFIGYMDKPARICLNERWYDAILRSVDSEGNLWAEINGKICPFSAAEISVRI